MHTTVSEPVNAPAALDAAKSPPSFFKGLALAVGTVALSMWGLGSLWLHAEQGAVPTAPDTLAQVAPAPAR